MRIRFLLDSFCFSLWLISFAPLSLVHISWTTSIFRPLMCRPFHLRHLIFSFHLTGTNDYVSRIDDRPTPPSSSGAAESNDIVTDMFVFLKSCSFRSSAADDVLVYVVDDARR
jgi:hypothetical protein